MANWSGQSAPPIKADAGFEYFPTMWRVRLLPLRRHSRVSCTPQSARCLLYSNHIIMTRSVIWKDSVLCCHMASGLHRPALPAKSRVGAL